MIQFRHTMDQHSREIVGDGKSLGHIMWHPGRSPRVVMYSRSYNLITIPLEDLRQIVAELENALTDPNY